MYLNRLWVCQKCGRFYVIVIKSSCPASRVWLRPLSRLLGYGYAHFPAAKDMVTPIFLLPRIWFFFSSANELTSGGACKQYFQIFNADNLATTNSSSGTGTFAKKIIPPFYFKNMKYSLFVFLDINVSFIIIIFRFWGPTKNTKPEGKNWL